MKFHFGFGAPKVNVKTPEQLGITNDPAKMAAYQDFTHSLNGIQDQGNAMNKASAITAGTAIAPFALGAAGAGGGVPGDPTGGGTGGGDTGTLATIEGLAKQGVGWAVDFLKNHGSDLLQGAGVADAAYREMQADKYATQAFKMAQDAYNAKAPLRAAGIAGMQAPTANPFSTNQYGAAGPPNPAPIPMGTAAPRPPAGPNVPFGTPINFGRLTPLVPGQ